MIKKLAVIILMMTGTAWGGWYRDGEAVAYPRWRESIRVNIRVSSSTEKTEWLLVITETQTRRGEVFEQTAPVTRYFVAESSGAAKGILWKYEGCPWKLYRLEEEGR
jgi:hypothetical protein